jgi:hypothetical protein
VTYSSGIRSALLAFVLDPSPRVGSLDNAPDEKLDHQHESGDLPECGKDLRLEESVGHLLE